MKKVFKFIFFFIISILLAFFCFYKYQEHKFNKKVNFEILNILLIEIQDSKKLPNNFYKIYNELNPNGLKYDLISSIINKTECQSLKIARRLYPQIMGLNNGRTENLTFQYFLTNEIEKNSSQEQCLNWTAEHSDFLYGAKGIENASKFYFKKIFKNWMNER